MRAALQIVDVKEERCSSFLVEHLAFTMQLLLPPLALLSDWSFCTLQGYLLMAFKVFKMHAIL